MMTATMPKTLRRMTLRRWILTIGLAAGGALAYAAVPVTTPTPTPAADPAGNAQRMSLEPVANAGPADDGALPDSADEAARRGELARSCNEQARARRLMGDDRRVFMIQCMHR
jgi:hypothetical protein